jgi:hypothetical protein
MKSAYLVLFILAAMLVAQSQEEARYHAIQLKQINDEGETYEKVGGSTITKPVQQIRKIAVFVEIVSIENATKKLNASDPVENELLKVHKVKRDDLITYRIDIHQSDAVNHLRNISLMIIPPDNVKFSSATVMHIGRTQLAEMGLNDTLRRLQSISPVAGRNIFSITEIKPNVHSRLFITYKAEEDGVNFKEFSAKAIGDFVTSSETIKAESEIMKAILVKPIVDEYD